MNPRFIPLPRLLVVLALLLARLVAPAQNVGIGTTSPTQALDVNGQLRVRGLSGSGAGTRLPQVQADGTLGLFALPPASAATDPYAAQPLLLNPNPAGGTTGGTATGNGPYGLALSGTIAYIVNPHDNTLQAFDVSTPASPKLLGAAPTDSAPYGVAVSGTTAYVVNSGSNTLQVFDVSTPASPRLRGTAYTDDGPFSIAVSGTTAYVVNSFGNTLQVFDVSTPASPKLLSGATTGDRPYSIAGSGTTVYVVNYNDGKLQAFDVSAPARPKLLGTVPTGSGPFSVAVSGTTAYVGNSSDNTLQTFDVSTPASPKLLGTVPTSGGAQSIAVSGTVAYVVNSSNALQVFDVSAPASPRLLGTVPTGNNPASVAVSGTAAYVVNFSENTLQAFQVRGAQAVGLQADGSLGLASAPRLTLSGQTLGIAGGNSVTLPTQPGDNLGNHTATQNLNLGKYQLVGNGGSQGLGIGSSGQVGIGTSAPYSLLANTSQNITASDNQGGNAGSLAWLANQSGYAGQLYNAGTTSNANGLALKIASASAAALDVSLGPTATAAGTSLLRVLGSGQVGIGVLSPTALLDVAGSTRLRGLGPAGVVTTDASGNLNSAAASSLGDNLGNHAATQNLSLNQKELLLLAGTDTNHGLGYYGSSKPWNGLAVDGPVLYGYSGGLLGTTGGQRIVLAWTSSGRVGIGTTTPAATLDVAGYTRLAGAGVPAGVSGATASVPAVAVLALNATLPTTAGGQVFVVHGLSDANILSVTALASGANGDTIPPGFTLNGNGELYGVYLYSNQVVLQTGPPGTSAGMLGKAVRVLITYRQ